MSRYIATRAIRGANYVVNEFEIMLGQALAEKGPQTPVAFPNPAYNLPLILGMTGRPVEKLGDLQPVLDTAKGLLHPVPPDRRWTPHLGEALGADLRRHEGRHGARHPALQQESRVRLRAGAGRSG